MATPIKKLILLKLTGEPKNQGLDPFDIVASCVGGHSCDCGCGGLCVGYMFPLSVHISLIVDEVP